MLPKDTILRRWSRGEQLVDNNITKSLPKGSFPLEQELCSSTIFLASATKKSDENSIVGSIFPEIKKIIGFLKQSKNLLE